MWTGALNAKAINVTFPLMKRNGGLERSDGMCRQNVNDEKSTPICHKRKLGESVTPVLIKLR